MHGTSSAYPHITNFIQCGTTAEKPSTAAGKADAGEAGMFVFQSTPRTPPYRISSPQKPNRGLDDDNAGHVVDAFPRHVSDDFHVTGEVVARADKRASQSRGVDRAVAHARGIMAQKAESAASTKARQSVHFSTATHPPVVASAPEPTPVQPPTIIEPLPVRATPSRLLARTLAQSPAKTVVSAGFAVADAKFLADEVWRTANDDSDSDDEKKDQLLEPRRVRFDFWTD